MSRRREQGGWLPTIGGARREEVAVEEGWGNMNYEPGFAIALRRIYILNLIKSFYDRLIIFPKKNKKKITYQIHVRVPVEFEP
jgi:hypothetical protein